MAILLRERCREQSITLTLLAHWTGIARVSLSRYAHGAQDMTVGQLLKIASCLGCRVSDLVDDRPDLSTPDWRRSIRRRACDPAHRGDKSWVPRAMMAARDAAKGAFRE